MGTEALGGRRAPATRRWPFTPSGLPRTCSAPASVVTLGLDNGSEGFAWIRAYSPYENIRAQAYPDILVVSGFNDTRVGYWEAAKWVARLRATATGAAADRADFLLRTEMSAGHGGVSGRYKAWHDRAFALAWILDRMGLA